MAHISLAKTFGLSAFSSYWNRFRLKRVSPRMIDQLRASVPAQRADMHSSRGNRIHPPKIWKARSREAISASPWKSPARRYFPRKISSSPHPLNRKNVFRKPESRTCPPTRKVPHSRTPDCPKAHRDESSQPDPPDKAFPEQSGRSPQLYLLHRI